MGNKSIISVQKPTSSYHGAFTRSSLRDLRALLMNDDVSDLCLIEKLLVFSNLFL